MSTEWRQDAACRGLSAEERDRIFFPRTQGHKADYDEALSFCERCPVRAECLVVAMEAEHGTSVVSRFGMFGGLTPHERVARSRVGALIDGERHCVWCDVPFTPSRAGNTACTRACSGSHQAKQARKRSAAARATQRAERGAA